MGFSTVMEDYPFDDPDTTAMRHIGNRKIFALILHHGGQLMVNIKHDPMMGEMWRSSFPAVIPGYHMNKLHWSSIILDGSVPDEVIAMMLEHSFDLTKPKQKHRQQRLPKE
ncbi:MAG: MmcQ/YjbR family DNA-binding protein [Clostridia bacterium]|nr:MmcQ/YjbR family DNA-binding protein [Clostridia bacterium]